MTCQHKHQRSSCPECCPAARLKKANLQKTTDSRMLDRANKQHEALTNDIAQTASLFTQHNNSDERLIRATKQKETAELSLNEAVAEVLQAEALYEEQQAERKLHDSTFPTSRMLVSFFLNMSTGGLLPSLEAIDCL